MVITITDFWGLCDSTYIVLLQVNIVRDPDNRFNSNNFLVTGNGGENLGTLSAQLCNALAPAYDAGAVCITNAEISYLERIRDRSRYAKQGVLFVRMEFTIQNPEREK